MLRNSCLIIGAETHVKDCTMSRQWCRIDQGTRQWMCRRLESPYDIRAIQHLTTPAQAKGITTAARFKKMPRVATL